jgi:hypothetical protein
LGDYQSLIWRKCWIGEAEKGQENISELKEFLKSLQVERLVTVRCTLFSTLIGE